ncbi:MAG: serine/threonine-protein phosphatase [Proteobacteria bacterium]|nr:serine/threonine-protein phosphatase [Pseudomonadota bacterium]
MEKYAISHQGLLRSNNEDRFLVMELDDGALLLAVADGMGGRAGGEVAAQLTVALLQQDQMFWAQVGDSRLYIFRNNELQQLTTDHNMAQLLVELGEISAADAAKSPFRHILNQCVGQPDCRPDIGREKLEPGDIIMLCTDGLHGSTSDAVVTLYLERKGSLARKADNLVQKTLRSGGRDNVTIILAAIE